MSITELTTASAWIAGLAIVALVAAGWRKPARATANPVRAPEPTSRRAPVPVDSAPTPVQRRTPVWRRVWAVLAGGVIGVVTGAVLAIVLSGALAWSVISLTRMLRR